MLGKKYPVRIAAPGNAETGQLFFSLHIFPRSCMDLPEAGEVFNLLKKHKSRGRFHKYYIEKIHGAS